MGTEIVSEEEPKAENVFKEEPEAENDEIKAQSEEGEIELNATAGSESSQSPKPENLVDEESEPMQDSNKGVEHKMTKYKVLGSEKYKPENGFQELDAVALDLVHSLITFESNGSSTEMYETISLSVIEALFRRDFKEDGDQWDVDPATSRELEEDEGGGGDLEGRAFVVKQQARYDSDKSYSVAAAKGTVTIWPEKDEIRIENYSYFVAG